MQANLLAFVQDLFETVRGRASRSAWSRGVELARTDAGDYSLGLMRGAGGGSAAWGAGVLGGMTGTAKRLTRCPAL